MAKEDIPFELIELLDPVIKEQKNKVSFSHYLNEKNEMIFKSNLFDEKFYFNIKYVPNLISHTAEGPRNQYAILYYPASENTLQELKSNKTAKGIIGEFSKWLRTLDKFENSKTFLDDPVLESYQKDIFDNTLKFIEEDDDDKPYPLESQINFINYLEQLQKIIKKEILITKSQEDKSNLKQSLKLIEEIKSSINKLTKGDVKGKFTLSLAYIAKTSLQFFRTITTEIIKEIAVKAITGN